MAAEEVRRPRGGGRHVPELQRGRLLSATFTLVGERGYEGVTARSVSECAGVSNRTFYECFSDREDCFLAAFNHAIDELGLVVRMGWESELGWTARVRAALAALLQTLDREPAVRRLVFVEALAAGPRVLACRARVLESLAAVVDEGRLNAKAPGRLPALVAEGVVGATFGVIHARLLELRPEPLVELLGSLMATIVLPYRGSAAAARELEHPAPPGRRGASRSNLKGPAHPAWRALHASDRGRRPIVRDRPAPPIAVLDYRLTVRTQMALAAVAGRPGLNNREVSEIIGLSDQSQISRMMKRLSDQGLVEDTQAHSKRQARVWRLTADGEAVIDAHRGGRALIKAQRTTAKGGKLVAANSGRRGKRVGRPGPSLSQFSRRDSIAGGSIADPVAGSQGSPGRLRMTALTCEVLAAVASLAGRGANPLNREVAQAAGVKDEGQISKLLARLQAHGLLENTGGPTAGGNAWRLTPNGEEILSASRPAAPKAAR